jgi:hypothetical protein
MFIVGILDNFSKGRKRLSFETTTFITLLHLLNELSHLQDCMFGEQSQPAKSASTSVGISKTTVVSG